MKVIVLLAVLSLVASGDALKCYSCSSVDMKLGSLDFTSIVSKVTNSLSCEDFDPANPDKKFEKECSAVDKACVKIMDPDNPKNQLRGCFAEGSNECKDKSCFCTDDLCNSSERGWPSVVMLVAALAAALVGGR